MIGKQRQHAPKADEFDGEWPRSFQAVALRGIYDGIGEGVFDVSWSVVRMVHNGEEYRPFIDAGANEHGVEYAVKCWYRLGDV